MYYLIEKKVKKTRVLKLLAKKINCKALGEGSFDTENTPLKDDIFF